MKKVLVITVGYPHPKRGASSVLIFWYLHALRRSSYDVTHLLLVPPEEVSESEATDYIEAIAACESFKVRVAVVPRVRHTDRFGLNLRACRLTDEALSIVKECRPAATVCFDIFAAMIARQAGLGNLLVWLGDLTFQTATYHALYDVRDNIRRLPHLAKGLAVAWLWKRCYRAVLRDEKHVIVSSGSSVEVLAKLGVRSKYQPYPWPASGKNLNEPGKHEKPSFIMFGTLSALGSRSALDFLFKSVYPVLINKWGRGSFTVFIAGMRELPAWVGAQIQKCPEFSFLGFVDDLAAEVSRCHAVLAPIAVPVGNRSRILTAMAMGAVVIAHSNTALGNPELVSGRNCLLARSPEDFAGHMVTAFESPESVGAISEEAAATYHASFEPARAAHAFVYELDRLLSPT